MIPLGILSRPAIITSGRNLTATQTLAALAKANDITTKTQLQAAQTLAALTKASSIVVTPVAGLLDGSESDGTNLLSAGNANILNWQIIELNAAAVLAPDGTTTARQFIETNLNSRHIAYIGGGMPGTVNGSRKYSIYLKKSGRRYHQLSQSISGDRYCLMVDFDTKTFSDLRRTSDGTSTGITETLIEDAVNGFIKVSFRLAIPTTGDYWQLNTSDRATTVAPLSSDSPSYTGDTVSGVIAWRPKMTV